MRNYMVSSNYLIIIICLRWIKLMMRSEKNKVGSGGNSNEPVLPRAWKLNRYIYIYIGVCMYTDIHAYICICTYIHIYFRCKHIFIKSISNICIFIHMHFAERFYLTDNFITHTHVCVYVYENECIKYRHINTYTNTQVHTFSCSDKYGHVHLKMYPGPCALLQ